MEDKRARRRRDKVRMKAKAVRIFTRFGTSVYTPKRHEKLADHIAHCSNMCCGNPRRWFGEKTMQERRFEAAPVE